MNGDAHWLIGFLFAAGGLAALVLYRRRGAGTAHLSASRRTLECPKHKEQVDVLLVRDLRTGYWTGARSCSLYGDEPLTCSRSCVDALNSQPI